MNINKDQNLRNLDKKLKLVTDEFVEHTHYITDPIIDEKGSVNGYDLQNVCKEVQNALVDFRKNIISYLKDNE